MPEVEFMDAGAVSGMGFNGAVNFGQLLSHGDITTSLDLIVELTAGNITSKMVGDGGVQTIANSTAVAALENGDRIWFDFYYTRDGLVQPQWEPRPEQTDFTIASITTDTAAFVPEPSTCVLAAVGLSGLAMLERRRR